jgi:Tfp pilus assembly protein PilX
MGAAAVGQHDEKDRQIMWSIVGTSAVKQSPSAAKAQALTKTIGVTTGSIASSSWSRPRAWHAVSTSETIAT